MKLPVEETMMSISDMTPGHLPGTPAGRRRVTFADEHTSTRTNGDKSPHNHRFTLKCSIMSWPEPSPSHRDHTLRWNLKRQDDLLLKPRQHLPRKKTEEAQQRRGNVTLPPSTARATSLSAVAARCLCTPVSHISHCAALRVRCDTERVHVLVLCQIVQQPRSGVLVCLYTFSLAGAAAELHG